ncbi:anterior gradient 1 [Halichoeres trimaculatus]|uniref:anterior gradient 1 n=1 Tax=Halichoeres trimaculatus TaxID=147232 RepID=UPI003D9EB6FF
MLVASMLISCHCSSLGGQKVMLRWVLLALFFGICASAGEQKKKAAQPQDLSRGWGKGISWVKTYEEALVKTAKSGKPLMVIHHREHCPYSQELKKAFVAKKSILKMAKEDFIMLNLVEEPADRNMAPDGYYVPRILFVDPSKTVRNDIQGIHSDHLFTYMTEDIDILEENMKKAKVLLHSKHKEL